MSNAAPTTNLPKLPPQPSNAPWPVPEWPAGAPLGADEATIADVLETAFRSPETHGETLALLAVQGGRLVAERYAEGKGAADTFISWSMAKSILHALVGVLVGDGRLDPAAPAPVPRWQGPGDPRGAITLDHLLRQVDGLDFVEVYEAGNRSDVIDMLFQSGKEDVAAYAEAREAAHPPGTVWN
ncbi:MAG: serine hydrolase, partial [Myxococcales bacterium]|nr:serine hydrolase [Myxococcales bacterium]